jgi:hypothetical protein
LHPMVVHDHQKQLQTCDPFSFLFYNAITPEQALMLEDAFYVLRVMRKSLNTLQLMPTFSQRYNMGVGGVRAKEVIMHLHNI